MSFTHENGKNGYWTHITGNYKLTPESFTYPRPFHDAVGSSFTTTRPPQPTGSCSRTCPYLRTCSRQHRVGEIALVVERGLECADLGHYPGHARREHNLPFIRGSRRCGR